MILQHPSMYVQLTQRRKERWEEASKLQSEVQYKRYPAVSSSMHTE